MEVARARDRPIGDYWEYAAIFVDIHDKATREHVADLMPRGYRIERSGSTSSVRLCWSCTARRRWGTAWTSTPSASSANGTCHPPANRVQRAGRAGRSGQSALVVTYYAAGSAHDQ
jgi:hypothetical protein